MSDLIVSPATNLDGSLYEIEDLFRPYIMHRRPKLITFEVGAHVDGVPHIGTYLVLGVSFVLAEKIQKRYRIKTRVKFSILDNAPHDSVEVEGRVFQRAYALALGKKEIGALAEDYYLKHIRKLGQLLKTVDWEVQTYTEQQKSPAYRQKFLEVLRKRRVLRYCLAPSDGVLQIRIPCPHCGFAEKKAEGIKLVDLDENRAVFSGSCFRHGAFTGEVKKDGGVFLDLNSLFRNLIKEFLYIDKEDELGVMVKGGDWTFASQLVDRALGALGCTTLQAPMRIFTPQIVTREGGKLAKSAIRQRSCLVRGIPDWLLDMRMIENKFADHEERLVWVVNKLLASPRHFFRSYTVLELKRILCTYSKEWEDLKGCGNRAGNMR